MNLQAIIGVVTTITGTVVAVFVYILSRQQLRDSWLQTYKELHETFWSDSTFRNVRAWLACDSAYEPLRAVLEKRRAIDEQRLSPTNLTQEEYSFLESLDRFFNFLIRVIVINPQFKRRPDLWKKLFFDYWLLQVTKRSELLWYLRRFYEDELFLMLTKSNVECPPGR